MIVLPRPLAQAVVRGPAAKVIIIEGARAVGKTTMVKQELVPRGYSYSSLAMPATLALARADLQMWVDHLPLPAIVDEAQLIPELPLAVKERVDALPVAQHVVLTGSASIGRTGLGGADPLARRARRHTLRPLTGWELNRAESSIVDWLFDGSLQATSVPAMTDEAILTTMAVGGFPGYVLANPQPTAADMVTLVQADITGLLTDTVLPQTDFSALTARTVLNALLCAPGALFNASRIGQAIGSDRRTVDRYLGILARLFLVHWLPNLATSPTRQDYSRAKVHPVDSSFSMAALRRSGQDLAVNRELFGQVLESWIVNEIVAAMGWARTNVTSHFWRESAGDREVDLVLSDDRGRLVGIEVKAGRSYDSSQVRGLRALRKARGLHRGFIIHPGNDLFPVADDLWLLPVSVLARGLTQQRVC